MAFEEAFGILDSRIWECLALHWAEHTNRELSRELAIIGQEGNFCAFTGYKIPLPLQLFTYNVSHYRVN